MFSSTVILAWDQYADAWRESRFTAFVRPCAVLLWLLILSLPLNGMDRSDRIAGAVFTVFYTAVGVAIILAVPNSLLGTPPLFEQTVYVFFFVIISAARWEAGAQRFAPVPRSVKAPASRGAAEGEIG